MDGGQEKQLMAVLTLSQFLRKAEDINRAITPKAMSMVSKELEEESSKSKNKSVLSAVYFD